MADDCTIDTPCAACLAGLAMGAGRREPREATYGRGPPAPRRMLFWEGLCRASLLPRAYCAGCEQGLHERQV